MCVLLVLQCASCHGKSLCQLGVATFGGVKDTQLLNLRPFTRVRGSPLSLIFLQTVQAELDARRADWVLSLDQLAQYTDSLEKELIKMAGNMRRSRTEILHLSVR